MGCYKRRGRRRGRGRGKGRRGREKSGIKKTEWGKERVERGR